ncbi:Chymotrypsin-like elastase family member 2A [Seminavis robusta]|uniref:Chymotrypsin-like elastase family member 2A n=1 Tax=Seminavis robusta TaxID=568900 RepID=A0A9N8EVP5_9STRA|nr:Chymotrypsin-like elastase family member 2A [Seminavis robusta]|eukprot:Sro1748_g295090.1 Chymotrypsin-like elastase family member 2A (677) ;mRNA; r:333-2696
MNVFNSSSHPPTWFLVGGMIVAATNAVGAASLRGVDPRIVNGNPASSPYPSFGFFEVGCGSSIVAPDMVLTAAHCDHSDVLYRRLWFGSTELREGKVRTAVERFVHPNYHDSKLGGSGAYDFMLLKLNASILVQNDGVTPTNLEPIVLNDNPSNPAPNDQVLAIGHGRNHRDALALEENLLELTLFTYDNLVCQDIYDQLASTSTLMVVPESMFCAGQGPQGFGGTCNGDSGGPVVDASGVQVGVVSWGASCTHGYPSVFGRVSSAHDWMIATICENTCFPDPVLCSDIANLHPCASKLDTSTLPTGNVNFTLSIVSDMYPDEIGFLLEHVDLGMEVFFQPYETYSYSDVAGLRSGEEFIIRHRWKNLPGGTYHLILGDNDHDGICYGYSNCLNQENVMLSSESGETIWSHNGRYFSGTDIYVRFDADGNVLWVSEYELGSSEPTPSPTIAPAIPEDTGYPGEFPDDPFEVTLNVYYDSWLPETWWTFQKLDMDIGLPWSSIDRAGVEWMTERQNATETWTTISMGPEGLEVPGSLNSYTQPGLEPGSVYRFEFHDSFGDGIYTWGATITNSSASLDYSDGTVLWALPHDFSAYSKAHIWVDSDGNAQAIDYIKVPVASSYIADSCDQTSLASQEGRYMCEDVCARGRCCWDTTAGARCNEYQPTCWGYALCGNLL